MEIEDIENNGGNDIETEIVGNIFYNQLLCSVLYCGLRIVTLSKSQCERLARI